MSPFRIFLLSIAIAVVGTISAWWNSPFLIEYVLRSELASYGLDMPEFVVQRPYSWPVSIDGITVVSPSLEIRLSEIEFSPIDAAGPEIYVIARQVTFQARFHEGDATTSLDWQTLIESINSVAAFLPVTGEIKQLQWCREECLEGKLTWNRMGTRLKAELLIPDLNLIGTFLWLQDKSMLAVTGYRGHLFFGEVEFDFGETEIGIDGRARFRADTQPIKLRGEAPIHYELEATSLSAEFTGHLPLEGIVSTATVRQQLQAKVIISGEPTWQVEIDEFRLSSQQQVSLEIEIHEGILNPRLTKSIDIKLETPFLEQATLTVASNTTCAVGENISCTSPHAFLTARLASYEVFTSFSAIRFDLHKGDWQIFTSVELDLVDDNTTLISAELDLTADKIGLQARARTARLLGVSTDKLEVNHDLESGKGQVTIDLTNPAAEFQSVIDYLRLKKLNLVRGEFSLAAGFRWDLRSDPTSLIFETTITGIDLDVIYDDYEFRGGSFDTQLTGWPRIKSTHPANMSWHLFDIGIPIEDIEMAFDLDLDPWKAKYTLTGRSFDAAIFDGHLSSKDYDYEVTSQTGHLTLILDKLELNQILALQDEEFESSGKISGSVPVHVNQGKLSVSEGTIAAIEPGGFIKYKPSLAITNLVAQNEQLKVVVDTMSDFQYHSLEVELEYSPEGDLVARAALKGSNPAYENGREIHLNVKVEENIATLLKSLRLGGELTDKISEKAERGVQK